MERGRNIRLPVVTEQKCTACEARLDIEAMFANLLEPTKEDELGIPEIRIKCPRCKNMMEWQIRYDT